MLQGRGHCRDQRCPAIELSLSTALWPLPEALAQCDTLTTPLPSIGLEVEVSFCHLSEAHPCLIIIFCRLCYPHLQNLDGNISLIGHCFLISPILLPLTQSKSRRPRLGGSRFSDSNEKLGLYHIMTNKWLLRTQRVMNSSAFKIQGRFFLDVC